MRFLCRLVELITVCQTLTTSESSQTRVKCSQQPWPSERGLGSSNEMREREERLCHEGTLKRTPVKCLWPGSQQRPVSKV